MHSYLGACLSNEYEESLADYLSLFDAPTKGKLWLKIYFLDTGTSFSQFFSLYHGANVSLQTLYSGDSQILILDSNQS